MKNQTASASKIKTLLFSEWFLNSAGMLWLGFAFTILYFNLNNLQLVLPHEPLTGLSLRHVLWIIGAIFLAVGVACLAMKSHSVRVFLVIWLVADLLVYEIGNALIGSMSVHAILGYISPMFGIQIQILEAGVWVALLYLLMGGLFLIWRFQLDRKKVALQENDLSSGESLKTTCPACGGHIIFSAINFGQKIPCPHCQKSMILRKPDNLKMSCFFCQGHIEFPSHALGQKMPCPHCNKDITLKAEPI